MDPKQRLTILHPELLLFEAIIHETDFMPSEDVPRYVEESLDQIRDDVIENLRSASQALPLVRTELEQGWEESRIDWAGRLGVRPSPRFNSARGRLISIMCFFHAECAPIPSVLRPIMWRWRWEEERVSALELVPTWFHKHMSHTARFHTTCWDHPHQGPYALVWYDPRLTTREELERVRGEYRSEQPGMPARTRFPIERAWIEQQVLLWSLLIRHEGAGVSVRHLLPFTENERVADFEDQRDDFVEAFNAFVRGEDVDTLANFLVQHRTLALCDDDDEEEGPFRLRTVCDQLTEMRRAAMAAKAPWFIPIPSACSD